MLKSLDSPELLGDDFEAVGRTGSNLGAVVFAVDFIEEFAAVRFGARTALVFDETSCLIATAGALAILTTIGALAGTQVCLSGMTAGGFARTAGDFNGTACALALTTGAFVGTAGCLDVTAGALSAPNTDSAGTAPHLATLSFAEVCERGLSASKADTIEKTTSTHRSAVTQAHRVGFITSIRPYLPKWQAATECLK
jgi:hypothetical protein